MTDHVYLVRQDHLPSELPNYLVLLPDGGTTLVAGRKWATRFDDFSVKQALARIRRGWPMHTFRAVRLRSRKEG